MKRIGDILTRNKTAIVVEDGTSYKQVTIRTNYKGVCLRGTQDGSTILTKNQFVVSAGQFILSRIDARNGAFGIIPEELEGAIVTNDFLAFDINEDEVEIEFFNVFLQSPIFLEACIKASRGNTNRKRVDEDFFLNYEVNLPPRKEQSQLIKRINKGRNAVATAQHEITHQETLLAKLKQAILQEAIAGKLTADWRAAHPDVEPASQLLHRIQAEKARLIAAKKLRPEKPLPPITPAEIPFEIPKGWEWCRLGSIARHSLGKMLDHGKNKGTPRPYLRNLNVQWFQFVLADVKQMRFEDDEIEKYSVQKGDVVICEGGYPGQAAIWESEEPIMFQKALHRVRFLAEGFLPVLFVHYLKLTDSTGYLKGYFTGSGIKHFTGDALHSLVIPLPPLAEQAAIVERVEALMEHCRALEAEIDHTRTHAAQLLQAVLKEAFAPSSTNG
jgi:type I restriction enzyme S subunit